MDNLSSMTAGRRRLPTTHYAEDQAFDQIAKEAESRLIAKRQARTEAREIRMQEIERQQKEIEGNVVFDMYATSGTNVLKLSWIGSSDPCHRLLAEVLNLLQSSSSVYILGSIVTTTKQ